MLVWKLYQTYSENKLDFNLSDCLGDGADGEVFALKNDPNKVIKFCVLFNYNNSLDSDYQNIFDTISFIRDNAVSPFARVYEYSYLGKFQRDLKDKNPALSNFILYYYTMEKLQKISEDEKKVFHSIISHEDSNKVKNYTLDQIKKMLDGMSMGLDFDVERVMLFCKEVMKSPIIHNDLHVRNIMKDKIGNFKLIDFDRCTFKHSKLTNLKEKNHE